MTDPAAVFCALRRFVGLAPLRGLLGERAAAIMSDILTVGEVDEGHGFFDVLPPRMNRVKRKLRWIIAVRSGPVGDAYERPRCPDAHEERSLRALHGPVIEDLVACDVRLRRVTGRLVGVAPVLGAVQDPELAGDTPVRVYASPAAWLRQFGDGVLPIGTESEVQPWLRGCAPGLIAESVPHAEALLLKMRRDVPALPKLLVRAA